MTIPDPNFLIFDLDGTLLDSLSGIEYSVRSAFAALNIPLRYPELRESIGPPIRSILSRAGGVSDACILDKLESEFRARYDSEGWRLTRCFPEAEPVLRLLRGEGYRLFIVSNKPAHISFRILQHLEIWELFDAVLNKDSRVPPFRGKAEMVLALMGSCAAEAPDCLMLGDTIEDAEAAAELGISFAYMTHGYGHIPPDASVPVQLRLNCFRELVPIFAKELAHD